MLDKDIRLQYDTDAAALIRLCSPAIPIDTDFEFLTFWNSARSSIDNYLSKHQSPSSHLSSPSHLSPAPSVTPSHPETDTLLHTPL